MRFCDQALVFMIRDGTVTICGYNLSVFFDPPHLLKGLRNNFLNKNIIWNGKTAPWKDIQFIYDLDSNWTHKCITYINHVDPNKIKKMKKRDVSNVMGNITQLYTRRVIYQFLVRRKQQDVGIRNMSRRNRCKIHAYIYLLRLSSRGRRAGHTKEDLLGSHLDPLVLNKIRFALPTVELARAFCPECTSLSEKTYKEMKIRMLEWPFCVGLIIGPPSIGSRIRGSAVQNELIVASLAELKPLLLSRKEISRELADSEDIDDSSTLRSSAKSGKLSRIDKLEQNFSEMKEMLSNIMGRLSNNVDDESEGEAAYAFFLMMSYRKNIQDRMKRQ
ncbi:unnamed protein product [Colias eurytheme]|nr:unnamed protein product [Colias eurytheme]